MTRACAWLPALGLVLPLLASGHAQAFCRTNSCDPARGENCTVDTNGCRQGAKPLYWGVNPVPFVVQADGSAKNHIDAAAFETVLGAAFSTWATANCGSGKHPTIAAVSMGTTPTDTVEYTPGQSNANIFMFRDDTWMATIPGSALALTTVSYDWKTGQIYDADVEVNGTGGNITNGKPTDGADLPSIMTHEIGHFLGLDHSSKKTATMYISYEAGKGNLRTLDPDDVAAICTIYPPPGPSTHSVGTINVVEAPLKGCALAAGGSAHGTRYAWLASALGLLGVRRVRRARRARPVQ